MIFNALCRGILKKFEEDSAHSTNNQAQVDQSRSEQRVAEGQSDHMHKYIKLSDDQKLKQKDLNSSMRIVEGDTFECHTVSHNSEMSHQSHANQAQLASPKIESGTINNLIEITDDSLIDIESPKVEEDKYDSHINVEKVRRATKESEHQFDTESVGSEDLCEKGKRLQKKSLIDNPNGDAPMNQADEDSSNESLIVRSSKPKSFVNPFEPAKRISQSKQEEKAKDNSQTSETKKKKIVSLSLVNEPVTHEEKLLKFNSNSKYLSIYTQVPNWTVFNEDACKEHSAKVISQFYNLLR